MIQQKETKTLCYYVQKLSPFQNIENDRIMFYSKREAEENIKAMRLAGISAKLVALEATTTTTFSEKLLMI